MTQNNEPTVDNFFDDVSGGSGAPSAKLRDKDDFVMGTIVSQRTMDHIPFGKTEPELNRDGSVRKQLMVVLQTDQRNWAGVSKIPLVDHKDPSSGPKPASEDDGKRAVYLPQYSNIQYAVAEAIRKANDGKNGPLRDGATLGIKVFNLKDTGKGNPLKEHAAHYEAPAASADFFSGSQPAQEAPSQPQAPAATPEPAQQAPSQPQAPAPAAPQHQVDPWTGQPANGGQAAPPF